MFLVKQKYKLVLKFKYFRSEQKTNSGNDLESCGFLNTLNVKGKNISRVIVRSHGTYNSLNASINDAFILGTIKVFNIPLRKLSIRNNGK